MAYTEVHRLVLTYLRHVRSISVAEMAENFRIIAEDFELEADDPQAALAQHISTINIQIEPFGFKIASSRDQTLGELHYTFVNTRFDDVIKSCTPYTALELDAIKQLIDGIVNADLAFCLPQGNAKRIIGTVAKLKTTEASYFLARLVDDGWFELTPQNRLVLSPASLAELSSYMADRYGKLTREDPQGRLLYCHTCGDLVTMGLKCPDDECNSAFHNRCHSVYIRGHDGNVQCPKFRECGSLIDEASAVRVGPEG